MCFVSTSCCSSGSWNERGRGKIPSSSLLSCWLWPYCNPNCLWLSSVWRITGKGFWRALQRDSHVNEASLAVWLSAGLLWNSDLAVWYLLLHKLWLSLQLSNMNNLMMLPEFSTTSVQIPTWSCCTLVHCTLLWPRIPKPLTSTAMFPCTTAFVPTAANEKGAEVSQDIIELTARGRSE